ncbi:MarR family winged helix-turn-helix transcriptional regulator [Streptosporangium carneum]|uniref:MarR family winged helix-turn-helix transcriptional regulator n=1 Tax=Streptosporangium carneum TaxID=47481 RepID=UPI0022F2B173|nr:MarR family transcriptional regulator [Streptosporangium carneum]
MDVSSQGGFKGLGTQLRHLLELMDGDVARACADLGLQDYRPRFSPIVRALVELGPCSIRDLARATSVTHSAASQTVAQMSRSGLVLLEPGEDARQHIVHLTARARSMLPAIQAEWAATSAAAAALDDELPCPLGEVLSALSEALERRPFRLRIADAALAFGDDSPSAGTAGARPP